VPRFLYGFDETIDGGLILPRGLLGAVTALASEAGSRLQITDERAAGSGQEFTFTGTLTSVQREAVADLGGHDLGVLVAPPGSGKTVVACALIAAHATLSERVGGNFRRPQPGRKGSGQPCRPGRGWAALPR
jgi:hypothetical protein